MSNKYQEVYNAFIDAYTVLDGRKNALLVFLRCEWEFLNKLLFSDMISTGVNIIYILHRMQKIHSFFPEYNGIVRWRNYITLFSWYSLEVHGINEIINVNREIACAPIIMLSNNSEYR